MRVRKLRGARVIRRIYSFFRVSFLAARSVLGTRRLAGVRRRSACGIIVLGRLSMSRRGACAPRRLYVIRKDGFMLAFVRRSDSFFGRVRATLGGGALGVQGHRSSFLLDIVLGDIVTDFVSVVSQVRSRLRSVRRSLLSPRAEDKLALRSVRPCQGSTHLVGGYVLPLGRRVDGLFRTSGMLLRGTGHPFFGSMGSRLRFMLRALSNYHSVVSTLMSLCLSGGSRQVGGVVGRLAVMSAVFVPLAFLTNV